MDLDDTNSVHLCYLKGFFVQKDLDSVLSTGRSRLGQILRHHVTEAAQFMPASTVFCNMKCREN